MFWFAPWSFAFFLLLPTVCGVGFSLALVRSWFCRLGGLRGDGVCCGVDCEWGSAVFCCAGCGVLKSCGGIVAGGGTVASRPGRTRASLPTLALGFACAGRAKAPLPTRSVPTLVVHSPRVAQADFSVKVRCHKKKINMGWGCGKLLASGWRRRPPPTKRAQFSVSVPCSRHGKTPGYPNQSNDVGLSQVWC